MTARLERTTLVKTDVRRRAPAQGNRERLSAPFSLRCGAILIDYIVLAGIVAFSTLLARSVGGGARTAGGMTETFGFLVALVVAVLDLVVLPGLSGRSLGKWATGLRIERKDGRPLGMGHSLLRHFVGYTFSFLTLGLGFLIAAFSAQGRALHDIIAGTVVVRDEAPRTRAGHYSSQQ